MITADFYKSGSSLTGFRVRGHAGYDNFGNDIVCASVSSAVQYCANTITECFHIKADIIVEENLIKLSLLVSDKSAEKLLEGLFLHLTILSEDYEGTIKITTSEV